jgi:thioredoxin-related protein
MQIVFPCADRYDRGAFRFNFPTGHSLPMSNLNHFFASVLCVSLATLAITPCLKAEDAWTENISQAIEKAAEDDKDLLLLFTGSDWCPPCKKLEAEVLSNEDFQTEITKHFVLVKFDYPRNSDQDEMIAEQNKEWAAKFGVDSFPTIFLVDQALKPYAIAGYEEGGFQNYLGLLEESRQVRVNRDEKLRLADGKQGLERARLLDDAISELREEIVSLYYPEIVAEIVELDSSDELGLRTKWNASQELEMRKMMMTDLMMISRLEKPQRAIEFIDEVLSEIEFPAKDRLEIMQMKLNLVRQLDDNAKTDQILDEMINMDGVAGATRERLIVKKIYLMIGTNRDAEALKLLDDSLENGESNLFLLMAKGEILDSQEKPAAAIVAYDLAIKKAGDSPDVMVELVSAKSDALYRLKQETEALQTLDNFADNTQMPADLRSEVLLHKSLIMRDMNRIRQARLAENRAIEIAESSQQRAEMQKIVERLREKFGE